MDDYELLDSGGGKKLERFAAVVVDRPAPQVLWSPARPELWKKAQLRFQRVGERDGSWESLDKVPADWRVSISGVTLRLKQTSFGHLGVFPEHAGVCESFLKDMARLEPGAQVSILNLFAYTGLATLTAARAGAKVVHVDAARPTVEWARENARESGLSDHPIAWLVEDARKFVRREVRREHRYDGIILDPPSYGRGGGGEIFKIETDLGPLLADCRKLLAEKRGSFVWLSCHTPGMTPTTLENLLVEAMGPGEVVSGEMLIAGRSEIARLPSGCCARWLRL